MISVTPTLNNCGKSNLAVERFFPQSYGKSKQRYISETIDFFFQYNLWNKKRIFLTILSISVMNQPGQALTLFDGLFLKQFKRCRNEFLTRCDYLFENCRTKF